MTLVLGEGMRVEITDRPLRFTPRFDFGGQQVVVADYTGPAERELQLPLTFGSRQWLWSEDEHFRFDRDSRELCSFTFFLAARSVPSSSCIRPRAVAAGLRAETAREFGLPQTTVFTCDTAGSELVCLRDTAVPARHFDARLEIAPAVELLVRDEAIVGWSLRDPARYLTEGFAEPQLGPPARRTRRRLAECMALISAPLVDEVMERDTNTWARLRVLERGLRDQRVDRARARILHRVIARLIEDYA
ncbi:MAG: hypothetical protein HOQ36_19555 [Nocardia sp.]|nr:hypothetical protein [Nocardia sp.]